MLPVVYLKPHPKKWSVKIFTPSASLGIWCKKKAHIAIDNNKIWTYARLNSCGGALDAAVRRVQPSTRTNALLLVRRTRSSYLQNPRYSPYYRSGASAHDRTHRSTRTRLRMRPLGSQTSELELYIFREHAGGCEQSGHGGFKCAEQSSAPMASLITNIEQPQTAVRLCG